MRTHLSTVGALVVLIFATSGALGRVEPPATSEVGGRASPAGPVAKPEVRAVRLSLTSGDSLSTHAKTAETMRRLRDAGVNTVYISAWTNGYTLFPSAALSKAVGVDRDPALPEIAPAPRSAAAKAEPAKKEYRDLLGEAVLEAHCNGLIAMAWFEGGFLAAPKGAGTELARLKPQWLSRDAHGQAGAPDGSVWLNPVHPEVRELVHDVIFEAVEKYDLDGVQLDERLGWPAASLGYDDVTKKAYADEHFGQDPPADAENAAWLKWRADKSGEFVRGLVAEVASRRPDCVTSLAMSLQSDSPARDLAPWVTWSKAPWGEYSFRVDALPASSIESAWSTQLVAVGDAKANSVIMLPIASPGKPLAWDDVRKAIEGVRASGAAGHVLDMRGVSIDAIEKPLAAYYAIGDKGRSAHPRFGHDHRPLPTKLRLNTSPGPLESRVWRVMQPVPGTYAVTGVFNNSRRVLTGLYVSTSTPRKAYEVATPKSYEEVEIIPDRRPQKVPAKK